MTDRKQEMIDVLWEYPKRFVGFKWDVTKARSLYDRIAPLMRGDITYFEERTKDRYTIIVKDGDKVILSHSCPLMQREFPEIQEFCDLFLRTCNRGFYPKEIRPFYNALINILKQPKGTCGTCGGSQGKGIRLEDLVPCPDCEEERRSGDERRKVKAHIVSNLQSPISESGINPKVFLSGSEKGGLVEIWKTDQRLLKNRRKC